MRLNAFRFILHAYQCVKIHYIYIYIYMCVCVCALMQEDSRNACDICALFGEVLSLNLRIRTKIDTFMGKDSRIMYSGVALFG